MLMFLTLGDLGVVSLGKNTVRTPFSTCALIWSTLTFSGNSIALEKPSFPVPLSATCQTVSFSFAWGSSLPPSPLMCRIFPSSICTFMSSLLNPIHTHTHTPIIQNSIITDQPLHHSSQTLKKIPFLPLHTASPLMIPMGHWMRRKSEKFDALVHIYLYYYPNYD